MRKREKLIKTLRKATQRKSKTERMYISTDLQTGIIPTLALPGQSIRVTELTKQTLL